MNLILRLFWLRVRWTDLDQLRNVNNGVFLSMMDLGRVDLLVRTGVGKKLMDAAYYPVVAAQTITYRKSLSWWTVKSLPGLLSGHGFSSAGEETSRWRS